MGRKNSDDLVGLAVDPKGSVENPWVGAEAPLPDLVTEHDGPWRPFDIVGGLETSPEGQVDSEGIEEVGGDRRAAESLRLAVVR